MRSTVFSFVRIFLWGSVFCAAIFAGVFFFLVHATVVDFSVLENYSPDKATIVYDIHGKEVTRFQIDRHVPVRLQDIPKSVIDAFLTIEDRSFYSHYGVDVRGIFRSVAVDIIKGRKAQGASTITQQLVKLLFFDAKKSFERKLKEMVVTFVVEWRLTKDQILETYLNHVHLGSNIYGVEAACQRFWGKSVRDVSIAEAAMLAGIVRSSTRYCPLINPERALARRDLVLKTMQHVGKIDEQTYREAINTNFVNLRALKKNPCGHLREMIRLFLEDTVGAQALYTQGYVVQTTIDLDHQECAEKEFFAMCDKVRDQMHIPLDGTFTCIDRETGAIRALVGGYDFTSSQFNRATQARRQIGSIIKPFVYLAAIEKGKTFLDLAVDEPISIPTPQGDWEPRNVYRDFYGSMTLAYAMMRSTNIIAIKTLLGAGIPAVIDTAQRCGLKGPFVPYPSLALGCIEAYPIEVLGAFNSIINHGVYVEPFLIEWIKDCWGQKIWKYKPISRQVCRWNATSQVVSALVATVDHVRAVGRWCSYHGICAGKTGTTNDARTCWYIGATPSLTSVVYFGRDDNIPLGEGVYAMSTALPVWMRVAAKFPGKEKDFIYDPDLAKVVVDAQSGKPVKEGSDHACQLMVPRNMATAI
ncbi:MAG: Penicillin-binding protein, 1A family [candidate division TM6 bacterium GW2011_GWE2_41_16]|nr:MAG: Penicillin-binding protein, 1A family [candidate division TM6 bacterium GW2011_GWE2_41_16]